MGQIFGRATITIHGQVINSAPSASLDPGGVTRESETSDQKTSYVESLRPAMVKCKVPLGRGESLARLNDVTNATIQFQCDTGQTYVLANAWRVGTLELTGGTNAGVDLEFHADRAVEVGV